jgi:hypothetical protein
VVLVASRPARHPAKRPRGPAAPQVKASGTGQIDRKIARRLRATILLAQAEFLRPERRELLLTRKTTTEELSSLGIPGSRHIVIAETGAEPVGDALSLSPIRVRQARAG